MPKYSAPYTQSQAGKVERFNRTIGDLSRATVGHTGIILWGDAAKKVSHVYNRTVGNDGVSTWQRRWGRKPSRKHVRVFGCEAWYLNQARKWELDSRYLVGIFVGYSYKSSWWSISGAE